MLRGPPESPLHVPFPPVVSMQTTPLPTIPYTALHSALVMMGRSSTILSLGAIPPALPEGLPHPVQVTSSIEFNDYIKPSCMPEAGDTADAGELVTCTGWGKPSDNAGGIAPKLRMVEDLPIITNAECNAVYGIVGSGVVCIDTTGGRGTCSGDSGGPLNMKADMKEAGQAWKQVGIVSFGASAGCEVGYPAGFTRTEYYLDWISSNTGIKY